MGIGSEYDQPGTPELWGYKNDGWGTKSRVGRFKREVYSMMPQE
jgi:hypothetical protein